MKKSLSKITFFLSCAFASAQPVVVQSNQVFNVGTNYLLEMNTEADLQNLIMTEEIISGQNITWDFSSQTSTETHQIEIVEPNNAPYGSMINGNIVVLKDDGFFDSTYLDKSSSQLRFNGVVGFDQTKIKNTPYQVLAEFPLTAGHSKAGSFKQEYQFYVGIPFSDETILDSIRVRTDIDYNYIVEGWGTLTTPAGTFNVIQQKILYELEETVDYLFNGNSEWTENLSTENMNSTEFVFWSPDQSYPVMKLSDTANQGFIDYMEWIANPTLNNNDFSISNVIIYPNPAQDQLYLGNVHNTNVNALILDQSGRIIKNIASENLSSIDIHDLEPGVYILKLHSNEKAISKKFVKQ
jgi:hypothetical protein